MQWDSARIMLACLVLDIGICMKVTMGLVKIGVTLGLLCWGMLASGAAASKTQAEKVLRYAFEVAETGFDPAQVSDVYSHIVLENIFDALYRYDYLARPAKVVPNVAQGMPSITDNFKTFTVKLKPGIYFADDPAFGGKKRELTAHDYVYSYKRMFDPKYKNQVYPDLVDAKILGLEALRQNAEKPGGSFNYDTEVEGLRALDRYTIQFKLGTTQPRFIYNLADASSFGALAREVVEKYGDKIMEHPVGTGPFQLDQWTRSSKMTFVRNPNFREEYYEAFPPADDAQSQEIYHHMKGKRIPIVDRVEISIIEEVQPRWLAFLGNEHDFMMFVPEQFALQAMPNNQLAPYLSKRGMTMERLPVADATFTYFNMEDPVVGGNTPDKVALRRAIGLAYNTEEEIRLPRRNQAIPAQTLISPLTWGYDPTLKTEMSDYSPARAMALLDMYSYVDKDGDGWRDMPDGKPLVLEYYITPTARDRELSEVWKKSMNAVGIQIVFKMGRWPEHLKAGRAGKLMMWALGSTATSPDGGQAFERGYGLQKGEANLARFQNTDFDALYQQQLMLPDGPERLAILRKLAKIMVAYMPYKVNTHRIRTDVMQPWLIGYRRHPTSRAFWRYVDIDLDKLPKQ